MVELNEEGFAGQVQVANPASFVAQKLLIHKQRSAGDRARDILYIHDTLQLFGSRLAELRDEWQGNLVPQIPDRTLRALAKGWRAMCVEVSADIRRSALISPERKLSPDAIRKPCAYGLEQSLS